MYHLVVYVGFGFWNFVGFEVGWLNLGWFCVRFGLCRLFIYWFDGVLWVGFC